MTLDELKAQARKYLAFRDFGPEADKARFILKVCKLGRAIDSMQNIPCRITVDQEGWLEKYSEVCELHKEVFGDE